MQITKLKTIALTFILIFSGLIAQSQVYVNGYYKSNGTYVAPHYRTAPDSNPYNNYSFPGNYNPNKGKVTTGSKSSYLNSYYNKPSTTTYGSSKSYKSYSSSSIYDSIWDD